jgi:hypothetical protein
VGKRIPTNHPTGSTSLVVSSLASSVAPSTLSESAGLGTCRVAGSQLSSPNRRAKFRRIKKKQYGDAPRLPNQVDRLQTPRGTRLGPLALAGPDQRLAAQNGADSLLYV